ncbi:MAG: glycerophosphodiester phosphodiesterase family protein [Micrococcaceae bacterium]
MLPFFENNGPIGLAHRGFVGTNENKVSENSIRAFQNAVDLGYTHLETDVQGTKDDEVVIFHDDDTKRMLGIPGAIKDFTMAEIAKLELSRNDPIPTLVEVLETFPDRFFNIDIKTEEAVEPFVAVIEKLQCHDRICVASFSDKRRKAVLNKLTKRTATSSGSTNVALFKVASYLPANCNWSFDALNVPNTYKGKDFVTPKFVAKAKAANLPVYVWTVNDLPQMQKLLDMGVDGIFTDRADLLKEELKRREHIY